MKNLFFVLACILSFSVFGQGWEQTYGGTDSDSGQAVQQTSDGGYIIAGGTYSFGNGSSDVYLIKTDVNGVEQWSQTYGGTEYEMGYSVQQTSDGGYIIVGGIGPLGSRNVYLIKTDVNGVEQWSQTYGGTSDSTSNSVQQTTDGGYIICGYSNYLGNDENWTTDVYLIKTDVNGVEQWSQTYGGTEYESSYSVQQTTDGGYIIVGETYSFGNGGSDVYLIKTDVNGVEQWSQTYGGTEYEIGYSVQQTTDGGYIISGRTDSFGNGSLDFYLIKTDGNGLEQWSQTYGGTAPDLGGVSVQQTTDGGYVITGSTQSFGNGVFDIYLIKTDVNGVEQWSQTYGGIAPDFGTLVQQTSDGGYIISASTSSFGNGSSDVYLIKTDSEGTLSSSFTFPTPSNRKLDKVVDVLGREVNLTPNQILFHIYDDGSVEKKFVVE
jgi:hypothetical protein